MPGLIATGTGYETGAIQGFVRESAEQNEIDIANKKYQAQKQSQSANMKSQGLMAGAGLGYKVGGSDTVKNIFSGSGDSTGGEAATAEALGTDTLAEGGMTAGSVSADTAPTALGVTTATEASVVGGSEVAAGTVGAEATAGGLAAIAGETAAVEGGGVAAGAATGAEAGSTIGPWGTIIGAVVGLAAAYLFGR